MAGAFVRFVLCSLMIVTLTSGSAIPMWEFLSRGEKMSHLFNMFTKQVQEYCDQQSMPDCNKVLLVYGLTNLAKMEDDSLDKMDPYQRGATGIIWQSMMKGGYHSDRPTGTEDFYATGLEAMEPGPGSSQNSLGSVHEASSPIEQVAIPPGNVAIASYVIGPMVVRVLPDGRPVPEDAERPLPKDEDAEEFTMMRGSPVPSLEQVRAPGASFGPRERLMLAPKTQPNSPETQRQP